MAKHKVVHSEDCCTIVIQGNKASPEPTAAVIKFPGGHVEVSRASDGGYWAHLTREKTDDGEHEVNDSRIDYDFERSLVHGIPDIPDAQHVVKLAMKFGGRRPVE